MHLSTLVRPIQPVADLCAMAENLLQRQWALTQPGGQRLAFQVLHYQVAHAILRTDVIQRADVGMLQGRNGFGLALESFLRLRIAGKVGRKDLDGYRAIETGVATTIDFSHAARASRSDDLVRPKSGSSSERHRCAIIQSRRRSLRVDFVTLARPAQAPSHLASPRGPRLGAIMAEKRPQTFANHGRSDLLYQLFALPIFGLSVLWSVVHFIRHPGLHAAIAFIVLTAATVVALKTRTYSLRVQDRGIRLEVRLC